MSSNAAPAPVIIRRIPLPGGRQLVVRTIDPGDADGLADLYARLDLDDRYKRFFSAYWPPRAFFERTATVADRGGYGLVAVDVGADGSQRLVGEATYRLLPDGHGELEVTIERAWRGWLGAYLLDGLVSAARRCGVPNLVADVLAVNGPMLAVARSQPNTTMTRPDPTIVRVTIPTT